MDPPAQRKALSVADDAAQLTLAVERVAATRSAALAEARSRSELFHRAVSVGAAAAWAGTTQSRCATRWS